MRKLLLSLLLLISTPAFANIDQGAGQTPFIVQPNPVTYPIDSNGIGASLGIGYQALSGQYLAAGYGNTAIGYQAISGKMTAAAIGNTGIGFQTCKTITSGTYNTCIGYKAGPLTTGSSNVSIGTLVGNVSTRSNSVIIDGEGAGGSGSSVSNSTFIGAHSAGNLINNSVTLGLDAGYNDGGNGNYHTLIGLNVGRNHAGAGGGESSLILIGATSNSDVATTTTQNALGIGTGFPGQFDTSVGWGALLTNTNDSAKQAALGYNALTTSNVASAENSAMGYQACKLVSTGTNNLCLGYNAGSTTLTTGSSNILIGTSSSVTTPSASTSSMLNIGGLIYGHLAGTNAPTLSSCGTSPAIDAHANNAAGTVTAGGGTLASCTVTFASAYTTWNHCKVTSQAGNIAGFHYSYTTSALTITGTSITSDVFDYVCDGY